jgi:hypothetical protein
VTGGYEIFVPFRNFVSVDSLDWSGLTFHCVPFLSPPIRKPSQTQTLAGIIKNYGDTKKYICNVYEYDEVLVILLTSIFGQGKKWFY